MNWPKGYQHTKIAPEKRRGKIAYKKKEWGLLLYWCDKCGEQIVNLENNKGDTCYKCVYLSNDK